MLALTANTRIYQASTSELYTLVLEVSQMEPTRFYARSPYCVAPECADAELFSHSRSDSDAADQLFHPSFSGARCY